MAARFYCSACSSWQKSTKITHIFPHALKFRAIIKMFNSNFCNYIYARYQFGDSIVHKEWHRDSHQDNPFEVISVGKELNTRRGVIFITESITLGCS